jgi:hypothetical protein
MTLKVNASLNFSEERSERRGGTPTGNFTPAGVLFSGKMAQILCPNCDHENSRSFTVLHNISKIKE